MRIAVIDHKNKTLHIEDISMEDLQECNGSIEKYIFCYYDTDDCSWCEITNIEYHQEDDKTPIDIEPKECV